MTAEHRVVTPQEFVLPGKIRGELPGPDFPEIKGWGMHGKRRPCAEAKDGHTSLA